MPYFPNKIFSAKSTQYISLKAYNELYDASLRARYVAASAVRDTHTHRTPVTLVHVPRVNDRAND